MRRMRAGLCLVVVFAGASSRGADATKQDREKLQGTWKVSAMSLAGKAFPSTSKDIRTRIFTGDKMVIKDPLAKGERRQEATFKLDAGKEPRHIDFTDAKSGKTLHGIYQLEGDTLKIAYPFPAGARPTSFDGRGVFTETLKRAGKK